MKPYGLRQGDGEKGKHNKFGYTCMCRNKPRGKNKEAKLHKERCLVHRQARSDAKKEIRKALEEKDG